jgi:regulator of cell morphogenesis and NO signaling
MKVAVAPPLTLDVRELARTGVACADAVFAAFDGLQPGGSMVVTSGHAPRKLLLRLQSERPGLFEWSPLEAGPEVWRTAILRRDAAQGAKRGVNEALSWDHDRLDSLVHRVFEARRDSDLAAARATFAEFDLGLRRHIRFEEEILFPAFEERTGMPAQGGPTGVMRAEHREIEAILAGLADAVGQQGPAAETLRADLERVLGSHNQKEEQVLYPGIDGLLGAEEGDAVVRRIQAS